MIQKHFVGFYLMPIYAESKVLEKLDERLVGLLKGKTCFHIKQLDDELLKQIDKSLQLGLDHYKKMGWV